MDFLEYARSDHVGTRLRPGRWCRECLHHRVRGKRGHVAALQLVTVRQRPRHPRAVGAVVCLSFSSYAAPHARDPRTELSAVGIYSVSDR
jgi:hypothetical protein